MSATPDSTRPNTPRSEINFFDASDVALSDDGEAPLVNPSRNSKFYLEDEMSIFLVQNQLFKVHRHFLIRESELFRTMFQLPSGESSSQEGTSDDNPIVLPDVTVEEFEALLEFFYDGMHVDSSSRCFVEWNPLIVDANTIRWKNRLSISTRLQFDRLRDRCIVELGPRSTELDPIDRICLAQRFDIPMWYQVAYEEICARDHPLEVWEAQKIGLETAIRLAKTREALCKHEDYHKKPNKYIKGSVSNLEDRRAYNMAIEHVVGAEFWPEEVPIPAPGSPDQVPMAEDQY
ncbi:hypothetical protein ABKN59_010658 [Abortiporus biennis]